MINIPKMKKKCSGYCEQCPNVNECSQYHYNQALVDIKSLNKGKICVDGERLNIDKLSDCICLYFDDIQDTHLLGFIDTESLANELITYLTNKEGEVK